MKNVFEKIKAGDIKARDEFIMQNINLARKIAYDKVKNTGFKFGSLELDDLIQEAVGGLITAVDKYDPSLGTEFSTYATHWIERAIEGAVQKEATAIKIPAHAIRRIVIVNNVRAELHAILKREPDDCEIIQALKGRMKENRIKQTIHIINMRSMVELDAEVKVGDERGGTLCDLVADDTTESPEQYAERTEEDELVEKAVARLSPTEQCVIKMRYGMFPYEEATLLQTSEELFKMGITNKQGKRITKEGIRLIQERAENKLRSWLTRG